MGMRFRFKVVLVGDEAVGKTSLILRYIDNTFNENYTPTLGVNFLVKDLELYGTTRLIIWDIGGQESWKAKLHIYLKGADGAILVFDLTRPTTFLSLEEWVQKVHDIAGKETPFIIVGNKNDLTDLCRVKDKEIKKFLKKQKHSTFFKSSAKTGENVEKFFEDIARKIIRYRAK
ncbi:MAG: Rab family GTPase [Candidatus Helarchaeota archaeon]